SGLFADKTSLIILYALLPAVFASAAGAAFQGAVWGKKDYFSVSAAELIEQTVRVLVCVVTVFFVRDLLGRALVAAASLSIACAVSSGILALLYFKRGGKLASPHGELTPLLKSAAPISVMRIMSCVINSLIAIIIPNRLIAAGMDVSSAMQVYGASVGMAMSLVTSPLTLTGSLAMALVPEISGAWQRGHRITVRTRVEKAISFAVIISLTLSPVFIVLGREVGEFVFGSAEAGEFLRKAAVLMLPMSVEQITSSMMNSLGLEKKAFRNFLFGAAALIACLWFLPSALGIDALIVGLFLSNTVSAILHILSIRRKNSIKMTFLRPCGLLALCAVPAGALGYTVHRLIENYAGVTTLLTSAAVILATMVLLIMCFDLVDLNGFLPVPQAKNIKTG
ncbi:MAG: polysaccharide biosynthesis C-terminal domain-containing protein, partial [Clostridiales bacterium]|nr:polysaccharide biosynthesis C-terminal domain-containing protein [Clostridiales bacterium]